MNPQVNYIYELNKIFERKGWKKNENYSNVLNSLSQLTKIISSNDKNYNLILELLENFEWINLNDYYNKCRGLLINLSENISTRTYKIYTFPIIKVRHQTTVKSGFLVSYLIKAILPTIPKLCEMNYEDLITFENLKKTTFKKTDILLLVDDYIGTGDTLNECLNEIRKIKKDVLEQTSILTIAINKETLNNLKETKIYYDLEIYKGISDFNNQSDTKEKIKLMKDIESKLFNSGTLNEFSLGYKKSESLVSMLRTPDTNFPIFWQKYKKRVKLTPPFPRHENNK